MTLGGRIAGCFQYSVIIYMIFNSSNHWPFSQLVYSNRYCTSSETVRTEDVNVAAKQSIEENRINPAAITRNNYSCAHTLYGTFRGKILVCRLIKSNSCKN
ncbi:unnamed protein product [Ceratitis capitata]|uniref:(Mediterranean fruit fly) hypothetical protein n=1 Tax=Ceratitis capitata TaxID=7213 RepID=A0A811VLN8_CERCA|nr:unnamed protein product [Ceratitis capitata]